MQAKTQLHKHLKKLEILEMQMSRLHLVGQYSNTKYKQYFVYNRIFLTVVL